MTAKIVLIGSDKKWQDSKILAKALTQSGIDRSQCIEYWGDLDIDKLPKDAVCVTFGQPVNEFLFGTLPTNHGGSQWLHDWRGSIINLSNPDKVTAPENYLNLLKLDLKRSDLTIIPSIDPFLVNISFDLYPFLQLDLTKAASIAKHGLPKRVYREWFVNDTSQLERVLDHDVVALDTEMEPNIVGMATDDMVIVFDWSIATLSDRDLFQSIMQHQDIVKVAHNWSHDYAHLRTRCGVKVKGRMFDTMGGAHILNTGLSKDLSPSIATRFTNWPYHKWLVNYDQFLYNGVDNIVCYDTYWPMIEQLSARDLLDVSEHDHLLFKPLLDMQAVGFRIDEFDRQIVESELQDKLEAKTSEIQKLVEPVVESRLSRFQKPHLFKIKKSCTCCGGGTKARTHCPTCTGLSKKPSELSKADFEMEMRALKFPITPKTTRAGLFALLYPCKVCNGTGKLDHSLPFNPDSSDQVADVLYRGLGIRPRRYKGKETVKAAQLDAIKSKSPIIEQIVEYSQIRAECDTVERLSAGFDGKLHCVIDPWGTPSGRVACKEGLLEKGTNAMNIPVEGRRFVVPDPGYIFLYPDMAAIEARCVALLSGDIELQNAFKLPINWPGNPKHGKIDSHTRVMQLMLEHEGIVIKRPASKRLTYATMYGGEEAQMTKEINAEMFRAGESLRYTVDEVGRMRKAFFKIFNGVERWHERVLVEVFNTRRLRCPFTKRERTWNERIGDRKTGEVSREVKKQVWSTLPQNMGAWVLGNGIIDLYYKSGHWGELIQPLMHVHDALLTQARIEQVDLASEVLMSYLSRSEWGMWFPAEMKTGENWYEASV